MRRPRPARAPRRWVPSIRAPSRWIARVVIPLLLVLIAIGARNFAQPLPAVAATSSGPSRYVITGTAPAVPWPKEGSGAIGVAGLGLIATSGDVGPAPAASAAKVMTALIVLKDKPIAVGDTGPTLIITPEDVAAYKADAADQQSVVPVVDGEQLTEYEALEALLIPSGNNIAETLARWDAGSVSAFVLKMNQRAAALHLARTTFAEPSGISLQTVSTPSDLVALGMAAMQDATLAQVVGLAQTTLPVAGTVYNVNAALGQGGIVGIKTGFGLNGGATFLFAADATVDGHTLTLFGCVMGQPTLGTAFDAASALISTMRGSLKMRPIVGHGDVVGSYDTEWASHSNVLATQDVTMVEWPGMILHEQLQTPALAVDSPVDSGTPVGTMHIVLGDQQADVPLVTASTLDPPGFAWRLSRINL